MTPVLSFEAQGDLESKQACADLTYRVNGESFAEMHINLPYIRVHIDKTFGPYSLFDTGVKSIGHWCIKN